MINIRKALKDELDWINASYKEVDFLPSNMRGEIIAIAEVEEQRAGLGRLVQVENSYELGGMYIFEVYRWLGLARSIVHFLIGQAKSNSTIFCLPFSHLSSFYISCGFEEVKDGDLIPKEISKKHSWCNATYDKEVLLLKMHKK